MHDIGIFNVPDNIMVEILSHFHVRELLVLSRVCKHWQKLISDRWLWKTVQFSPSPIKKVSLGKIVRRYFSQSTKSVDICGKWTHRHHRTYAYALSNTVLDAITLKSPNLTTFKIEDENLKDVRLQLLPSGLKHLSFTSCEIPLSSFQDCSNKFNQLQSLCFRRCPSMTEKHLKCFGKLEKLERLEFYGCYRIDHDAVQVITTNFPNLHTLVMVGCAWCNDQSCRDIATRLNKLRSFEMEEWLDLTQTGVDYLLRHSKHLKFFSNKCKQLNNGGLAIHGSRVDV